MIYGALWSPYLWTKAIRENISISSDGINLFTRDLTLYITPRVSFFFFLSFFFFSFFFFFFFGGGGGSLRPKGGTLCHPLHNSFFFQPEISETDVEQLELYLI